MFPFGTFFLGVFCGAVTSCGGKQDGAGASSSSTGATPAAGSSAMGATGGAPGSSLDGTLGGSTNATSAGAGGAALVVATGGAQGVLGTGGSLGVATGGASNPVNAGGAYAAGGSGAQAVQQFTTTFVSPYCARLAQCCTAAGYAAPTAAACAQTELGFYEAMLADGSAVVNAAAVAALLDSIANSCDQFSYVFYGTITSGTFPPGAACTEVGQCQGDSTACIRPSSTAPGQCTTLTRGKVGDACAVGCDNTGSCRWTSYGGSYDRTAACWDEDGLRCDSNTNTCVALTPLGSACDSYSVCGVHADCRNNVCVAKGKLGESCADGRSCESTLLCNSSYLCEKASIAYSGSCSG